MVSKKYIFLGLLLLIMLTIIICCVVSKMPSRKVYVDFSEISESIENGDVSLTIYYMSPFIASRTPLSVDDLMYGIYAIDEKKKRDEENGLFEYKVIVNPDKLEEHIDLLNQICNADLKPAEYEAIANARIYFIFESKTSGKIFEVTIWGIQVDDEGKGVGQCLFVNGVAVDEDIIFYDVIKPFIPEDANQELSAYLGQEE